MTVPGAPRPPAELETARKILELERKQGFQDRAVTRGLAAFLSGWQQRVEQLGRSDLVAVAGQVVAALQGYAELPTDTRETRVEAALAALAGESLTAWPQETPHPPPPSPVRGRGGADGHLLPQHQEADGHLLPQHQESDSVTSGLPLARARARGRG
ncbi:MAG: hypothetical protein U0893_15775 [Chloroflexota bacterium]